MRVLVAFFLITVALGAANDSGREHWAFQPLAPVVPPVFETSQLRTPIDAFVLRKLGAKGLSFSPPAEREALLRRVSFDLIGLPPSPDELAAFLGDGQPLAYERVVDRLLASPHFGERWGRHWLDVSGYSDIVGGDNDAGIIKLAVGKWRYRDYVIRSFNSDKPLRDFVTEQLAGDELVDWRQAERYTPHTLELLTATTFLRATADDTAENELNTPDIRHGVLQRTGELVAGNLLALTFQCAKCHDHKYDPISQEDYYAFLALFAPAFNPAVWKQPKDRDLPALAAPAKAALDEHNAALELREKEATDASAEIEGAARRRVFGKKLLLVAEGRRNAVRQAFDTPEKERSPEQKQLVEEYAKRLEVSAEERAAALSTDEKEKMAALEGERRKAAAARRPIELLHATYDVGPPSPTYLLDRGDPFTPAQEVAAGFPAVLSETERDTELPTFQASEPLGETSGRRLTLARWLTTPGTRGQALVLRVFVNRAWQQLFGRGLVSTSGNFGRAGAQPTHPELLEWLAGQFHVRGESVKHLLRLLITSTVYRQSSRQPDAEDPAVTLDPENELLSRARLRRLESEVIRDAVLTASGALERHLGGPAVPLKVHADGRVTVGDELSSPRERWRRSVYILARRNYHLSMLAIFDQPVVTNLCSRRLPSAVVTQSLTMLNDAFVAKEARRVAERILASTEAVSDNQAVELAFRLLLTRSPRETERSWATEFLAQQAQRFVPQGDPGDDARWNALAELCHTLLNTSEFLYVP